ncbi:DUF1382 family protein [Pseudomonas gingeri]
MELARMLVANGILFVPMPVTGKSDHADLVEQSAKRLEKMENNHG